MSNLHRSNNKPRRHISIYRILPAEVAFFHLLSLPAPRPTWMAQGKGAGEIRLYGLSLLLVLNSYGESFGWERTVAKSAQFVIGNGHFLAVFWPSGKSLGWERTVVKSAQFDNGNGDFMVLLKNLLFGKERSNRRTVITEAAISWPCGQIPWLGKNGGQIGAI